VPERPDLEYVVPILARELKGATIAGVRIKKPVVLRIAVEGALEQIIVDQPIGKVSRRAHFVLFELPKHEIVVSPMLAGRFAIALSAKEKTPADLAIAWPLADGRELRYRDDVQMGKVYVITKGDWEKVPGLEVIGLDVLDPKVFTREAFRAVAAKRRDQVKVFLMDKGALDAMGNAYADEVLFEARLHPKTMVRSLSTEDVDRLHDAIVKVIGEATKIIAQRKPPLDEKLRDFLKVRNKPGEPCPSCGGKIRKAGVHGHDAFFCPTCQPETRKSAIVDWRRTGK
jgi:formamidopyrimidine-DNA glycosylase